MRFANVPLGVYVNADTPIHRTPAPWKFAFLLAFIIGTSLGAKTIPVAAACVALMAVGYVVARIPWRTAVGQLWPPLLILIPLAGFQYWQRGGQQAAVMLLTVYAGLMAAMLLTLTSTVAEMMQSLQRALAPLDRIGVPSELIALAMSLTIRLIPLMLQTVGEVLEARQARGAGFSVTAFATPVIIRSIRRARALGEALAARGVGD